MIKQQRGRYLLAPFVFAAAQLISGCAAPAPAEPPSDSQQDVQWEQIRSWTGRGSQQLDSFPSDTGALRIEWEARRLADAAGAGSLTIVLHSAISGRPLGAAVVDEQGEGKGTTFFSEEPRVFFADVASKDVEWKIAIAERVR